ncbi:MAG: inositol monophosphatase family protein [Pontiella sp.]
MNLSAGDLTHLAEYAIEAALKAGKHIAKTRPLDVQHKEGGESLASQVVTEVDQQSQDIILQTLDPMLGAFDLALLTEESEDDQGRLEKDYFWCIDPIDGTLAFIEGVPGYAVSIAFVAKDGTPHIGIVYDPVEATLYHAIKGQGAFRNSAPWSLRERGSRLQIFTDRSMAGQPYFNDVIKALDVRHVSSKGGAVMNAMWVLENPPACYFKFPKAGNCGGSLWDFAATACIFNEMGAVASDAFGNVLDLNRADETYMNHRGIIYASDGQLAQRIMDAYAT